MDCRADEGHERFRLSPLGPVPSGLYDSQMADDLGDLTASEQRFLVEARRRLHQLDPWTRGHFAECLVAELIGADLSTHTAAPHDLEWRIRTPAIAIAVRATGGYSLGRDPSRPPAAGDWKFPAAKRAWDPEHDDWQRDQMGEPVVRRCHADIAVLCHHHGLDITDNWTFHVLADDTIETWPSTSLRPSTIIAAGYPTLNGHEVGDAIRAIAH